MSAAKLTVTQGIERGKVFVLNGDVAHIGRSAENQVVLSDPNVAEHQATIANRNGRFAIYASGTSPLEINGKGNNPSCGLTACYAPLAELVKGCPPQLLDAANGKCNSMYNYCNNAAHAQEPFCTALDQSAADTLANDAMCKAGGSLQAAGSGAKIFGCATGSFWSGSPYCCAKVNRGSAVSVRIGAAPRPPRECP